MNKPTLYTLAVMFVAALILIAAWSLQLLWNGLMPEIFSLPEIRYIQALGLLVMAEILFKTRGGK